MSQRLLKLQTELNQAMHLLMAPSPSSRSPAFSLLPHNPLEVKGIKCALKPQAILRGNAEHKTKLLLRCEVVNNSPFPLGVHKQEEEEEEENEENEEGSAMRSAERLRDATSPWSVIITWARYTTSLPSSSSPPSPSLSSSQTNLRSSNNNNNSNSNTCSCSSSVSVQNCRFEKMIAAPCRVAKGAVWYALFLKHGVTPAVCFC